MLLSVLWGGAFFFVGVAVVKLPPLSIVLARVGVAAASLLGLTLFLGQLRRAGYPHGRRFLPLGP